MDGSTGVVFCSKCCKWKFRSEFSKAKNHGTGLKPNCKECRRKYHREWTKNRKAVDPDYRKDEVNNWRKVNPKACRAAKQRYYAKNRTKILAGTKEKRLGNLEEFRKRERESSRKRQNYPAPLWPEPECCELCGKKPRNRRLCLDHDHATNKFRGWLCTRCNLRLGFYGDSIEGVEFVLAYVRRVQVMV